ncbi:MAG: glycosyltransferase [Candidatus Omnitrophica bacterium]|nr:glycosyltransferase [Candidatus Omnitrophota bacterium]
MKIIILDYYYPKFLQKYHADHPLTSNSCFEEQRHALMQERFGTFDSYSYYFKQLGHEAQEFVVNDERTQLQWAKENGLKITAFPQLMSNAGNYLLGLDWRFEIVREQIRSIEPDVVLVQEQNLFTDNMIGELKKYARLMACQMASPLLQRRNYQTMDLVVSSFPHFIPLFRSRNMNAEYLPLAFDRRVLNQTAKIEKTFDVTFIGGVSKEHRSRVELLEKVCQQYPLAWFGYGIETLPKNSALRKAWRGEVWGNEMYEVLAASKMTVNSHIDVAEEYANNARLFEATGVGACLVTDWKQNLSDFFVQGQEALAYRTVEELLEKMSHYLYHAVEREQIAIQGQQKTLTHHSYEIMISRLTQIFEKYLTAVGGIKK